MTSSSSPTLSASSDDNSSSVGVIVAIVALVVVVFIIITVVVIGIIVVWKRKKKSEQHTRQEGVYYTTIVETIKRSPTNKPEPVYSEMNDGQDSKEPQFINVSKSVHSTNQPECKTIPFRLSIKSSYKITQHILLQLTLNNRFEQSSSHVNYITSNLPLYEHECHSARSYTLQLWGYIFIEYAYAYN